MRKSLSIFLLVLGLAMFVFGSYISYDVGKEKNKILQAETIGQGYRRPVIGPVRRAARANAAEAAQERIGEAKQSVVKSQVTANWLRGTGIAVFVVGAVSLIFSYNRKRRH